METTGLFVGKFLPPHIGHLDAIKKAYERCSHLIVIVCYEPTRTKRLCGQMGVDFITLEQRANWIRQELKDMNVEILTLDETGITSWPEGWEEWSNRVKKTIDSRHIDYIFGNEKRYIEGYNKYFNKSQYILLDPERKTINISATKIRNNLKENFNFIIDSAKPFFKRYIK